MHDRTASTSPPPSTVERSASAVPRAMRRYLSLDDFEATARRRLPKMLYGYISGAAETDAALADNRRAFQEYGFVPRVLKDVSNREQTTTLFGKTYAGPFGIPPMGSAALCAYRGDIVLTRAAAAMNVPMILSASSLITRRMSGAKTRQPGIRPIWRASLRASSLWSTGSPALATIPSS